MNKIQTLLSQNRPLVMGILNTTPDSFSDGGVFVARDQAMLHVNQMIADGADIIDVGGESTRPGAEPVSDAEEINRVVPVIEAIRKQSDIAISVDTSKPEVMRCAVAAGADMVNDVYALRQPEAAEVCAEMNVTVCLMHMQGEPRIMQRNPEYSDVVAEVKAFLMQRYDACVEAGIAPDHILLDPGFGFGKTLSHNLSLLKHLDTIVGLNKPVLVGISRKTMLGMILDKPVDQRLYGSVSAAVLAYTKGARILRVHDVAPTVDALKVAQAMVLAE